jgi:hypothetical protein
VPVGANLPALAGAWANAVQVVDAEATAVIIRESASRRVGMNAIPMMASVRTEDLNPHDHWRKGRTVGAHGPGPPRL